MAHFPHQPFPLYARCVEVGRSVAIPELQYQPILDAVLTWCSQFSQSCHCGTVLSHSSPAVPPHAIRTPHVIPSSCPGLHPLTATEVEVILPNSLNSHSFSHTTHCLQPPHLCLLASLLPSPSFPISPPNGILYPHKWPHFSSGSEGLLREGPSIACS